MKNVAIIGLGACGLLLAVLLEKSNIKYDIFNKGKIGRKILASGNGKCNISNANYDIKMYHNNPLADTVVKNNQNTLFELFKELKIYTKTDSEGRMYPISESSQSVLNILLKNITEKVHDHNCSNISIKNSKYYIDNEFGPYDYVVIATGSKASYKTNINNDIVRTLNIKFNEFYPSLVGFKTNIGIKTISGVRHKCMVSLVQNDNIIHSEMGEINFKDDGISGICVMNLSSYYACLKNKNNCNVIVDLLPNQNYDDYESILNPKLYQYVLNNKIDIHKFVIPIKDVYHYEFAQVCNGGIDISEINNNLSLKKYKGIYAGGEIIDVDGVCGGYNLMFAFCSSIVIWKDLVNEISNKGL